MTSNNTNNNVIAKNTVFLAIRMVFVLIISLYTSRVFLDVLGVEDFGIYNVVCGFVSMFAFMNSAMVTGIQRFYNYEIGKNGVEGANRVFVTSILTQGALAAIIVLLTETIGIWYLYNKMVIPDSRFTAAFWVFQFSIVSMVINIMSAPFSSAVMAHEKMDYYAIVSVLDAILKLGVAILLPFASNDKLIVYGAYLLIISVINFLLYAIYAKAKFVEIKFNIHLYKGLFKNLLSFSGWNIFGKLAIMFKEQGLNMVLNLFFGPVVNAARGVAFQVNGALAGFVGTVTTAVKPQMTQSYAQGNKTRTFSLMFSISKLCYIILLVFAVSVCFEIDYVLKLWLGNNVPQYTNIFVILVIMTTFINNLNAPVSFVVHATGIMKRYQLVTSCIEIMILPLSYFILKLGAEPWMVFVISFIFVIIGQIASLIILKSIEYYSLRAYFKEVIMPLSIISTISVLAGFMVTSLLPSNFFRLILTTFITLCITCLMSYFIVLNKTEKKMVVEFIQKRLKK